MLSLTHSTPKQGQVASWECSLSPILKRPTFTSMPEVSSEELSEAFVQRQKLKWMEELDEVREDITDGFRILRDQAEVALKDIKAKVRTFREQSKVLEKLQADREGIATEESTTSSAEGSSKSYFSIVKHTEPLSTSILDRGDR